MGGSGTGDGSVVSDSKRVVRLGFNQLSRTIHDTLRRHLRREVDAEYEIGAESPTARTFPPLSSPQEGSSITTGISWQKVDLIASSAGSYTLANLEPAHGLRRRADRCLRTSVRSHVC